MTAVNDDEDEDVLHKVKVEVDWSVEFNGIADLEIEVADPDYIDEDDVREALNEYLDGYDYGADVGYDDIQVDEIRRENEE